MSRCGPWRFSPSARSSASRDPDPGGKRRLSSRPIPLHSRDRLPAPRSRRSRFQRARERAVEGPDPDRNRSVHGAHAPISNRRPLHAHRCTAQLVNSARGAGYSSNLVQRCSNMNKRMAYPATAPGRKRDGDPVEPGLAAAGADAGGCRHVRRFLRRHPVDDLHVVHQQPALPRLRDRSRRASAGSTSACSATAAWTTSLENLVILARRQRARHRLRLHPRRDGRAREARRGLLPHHLPLPAGDLADRHRPGLALDVQPRRSASRPSCTGSA